MFLRVEPDWPGYGETRYGLRFWIWHEFCFVWF